jgi:hypothetical protein
VSGHPHPTDLLATRQHQLDLLVRDQAGRRKIAVQHQAPRSRRVSGTQLKVSGCC